LPSNNIRLGFFGAPKSTTFTQWQRFTAFIARPPIRDVDLVLCQPEPAQSGHPRFAIARKRFFLPAIESFPHFPKKPAWISCAPAIAPYFTTAIHTLLTLFTF
jgi:hypothetical protein